MTIVVNIVRDDFSMIAMDSRITLLNPVDKLYDDSYSKLCETKFGWLAGTGYGGFIQALKSAIIEKPIVKVDDVEIVYKEVYKDLSIVEPIEVLNNTMVVYSFPYLNDTNEVVFHIESLNPVHGRAGIKDKNIVVTLPPEESDQMNDVKQKYHPLIENSINMNEIIYKTACYIKEVSLFSNGVSSICDYGLIFKDGPMLTYANIRGEADIIIQNYLNNNLSSMIKVHRLFPYIG